MPSVDGGWGRGGGGGGEPRRDESTNVLNSFYFFCYHTRDFAYRVLEILNGKLEMDA